MSREAELYKDKIEVSLDGRQIFYLFFGGAVIVGLVFVLGVMVGRRVEARGHTDRARVAATVDPLAALDRLEGGSGLSFQGALRGADGPVSDVEKQIAALPAQKGIGPQASGLGHKDDANKEPVKAVEPKKDEPKTAELEKDELEREQAKKDGAKAEVKKDDAKADAKKDDAKAEAKKDDAKADAKKDDAKAEVKKDDAKADAKKDEAKQEKKPKYTLQLSSFQDKAEAQAYLEAMKATGYQPYMTQGSVDGKQYFRVRMGSYSTLEAANQARAALEKSMRNAAIVIKL